MKTPVVSALLVAIMGPQPWELRKPPLFTAICCMRAPSSREREHGSMTALVFRHGAILQREGFDAGIGEGAPGDPGDMVIVMLFVASYVRSKPQRVLCCKCGHGRKAQSLSRPLPGGNSSCPSHTRGYGAHYSGPGVVKSTPSLMLPWPLWGKFGSDGFPGARPEAVSAGGKRMRLSRASRSQRCCIWDRATNWSRACWASPPWRRMTSRKLMLRPSWP